MIEIIITHILTQLLNNLINLHAVNTSNLFGQIPADYYITVAVCLHYL